MSDLSRTEILRSERYAPPKWIPLILIALGIILVVGAMVFPLVFRPEAKFPSARIPQQVAGFSLVSEVTGSAAMREFTQLHGKSFPVSSGAKAVYGTGSQVIIWAAGTASVAETRKLLEEMRDKIALGRSPFQSTGIQTLKNRDVYGLDGMGQKHFYFQSGKYLVWLAANADVADQALQQVLNFYP